MPFRTRNPYYLRISDKNVVPLYLYLDERHLDWMSDLVLQHVLSDLRPHILPKLKAEVDLHSGTGHASSKKATVDTHRGETYQFCYFIRKTEPHSVVVKTRNFVAAPPHKKPTMPPPPVPSTSKSRKGKRKGEPAKSPSDNSRKKRKTKGKGKARQTEEVAETSGDDDGDYLPNQTDNQGPRRSGRASKNPVGIYREIDDEDEALPEDTDKNTETIDSSGTLSHDLTRPEQSTTPGMMDVDMPQVRETVEPPLAMEIDLQADEEEEKPKPMLQLRYQGFSIYGHCLCVVVEPWPPIRSMSRASSVAQSLSRAPSIAPPEFMPSGGSGLREKTPLFLPDYDSDRERSETPAPFQGRRILPPGPNFDNTSFFDDSDDSDDGGGGMMEFSQVLSANGEFRAGAVDDDEDVDTSMFFGDADEAREL